MSLVGKKFIVDPGHGGAYDGNEWLPKGERYYAWHWS